MKTKRRHELQTNKLADWLGQKVEQTKPHVSWILTGIIAVILLLIALSVWSNKTQEAQAGGWARYDAALNDGISAVRSGDEFKLEQATGRLESVAEEYAKSRLEAFVRIALGDIFQANAERLLHSSKSSANESFQKARKNFDLAAEMDVEEQLKSRARFSLAKTCEWMQNLEAAKRHYQQVTGLYKAPAAARLEDLGRPATKRFYDQFASLEFRPPPPATRPNVRRPTEGFSDPEKFGAEFFEGSGPGARIGPKLETPGEEKGELGDLLKDLFGPTKESKETAIEEGDQPEKKTQPSEKKKKAVEPSTSADKPNGDGTDAAFKKGDGNDTKSKAADGETQPDADQLKPKPQPKP